MTLSSIAFLAFFSLGPSGGGVHSFAPCAPATSPQVKCPIPVKTDGKNTNKNKLIFPPLPPNKTGPENGASATSTIKTSPTTTTTIDTDVASGGNKNDKQQQQDRLLEIQLRSKSIKELKIECSRRNIQYGKFSKKNDIEEYVKAIRKDVRSESSFSVTGLIRPGELVELTGEQIDEETSRRGLVLVDVYATWCGPCRAVLPFLESASRRFKKDEDNGGENNKVRFVKLNSDEHPSWASKHKVEGLPTILLMNNGYVIDRFEGTFSSEEDVVRFVKRHLVAQQKPRFVTSSEENRRMRMNG